MTENATIPQLERITFFTGQRLTAADLSELQRSHRELRWLHNRALHGWGIGIGLGAVGERGDTAVTVEPGYGVDCLGREILLTEGRTVPVPAVAGGGAGGEVVYYLTASYLDNDDQKVAERRPGVCAPAGTVRLSEEPALDWRRPEQLKEGRELVLAQAWILGCRLSRALSLAPRRYARPAAQPFIAAGQTVREDTEWQPWQVDGETVGVLTRVDASAARFRSTPRYTAHLVGERVGVSQVFGTQIALGFPSVVEATAEGFTFQVLLPDVGVNQVNPPPLRDPQHVPEIFNNLSWHVVWMGIEG